MCEASTRMCKSHPEISCEKCKETGSCPYIYCQHIDCMNCYVRYLCPMCAGECSNCDLSTYCKICTQED